MPGLPLSCPLPTSPNDQTTISYGLDIHSDDIHSEFKTFADLQYRADCRLAPSQWEMLLQSNAISHWLGANLESALAIGRVISSLVSLPQPSFDPTSHKPSKCTTLSPLSRTQQDDKLSRLENLIKWNQLHHINVYHVEYASSRNLSFLTHCGWLCCRIFVISGPSDSLTATPIWTHPDLPPTKSFEMNVSKCIFSMEMCLILILEMYSISEWTKNSHKTNSLPMLSHWTTSSGVASALH